MILILSAGSAFGLPAQSSSPSHKPDYSKEPAVIESFKVTVRLNNDGTETRETTSRIRVQSDVGVKTYGLLAFGYDSTNQRLKINYVKVIKPDGTVISTPATNIQDVTPAITRDAPMYSDYREKHIAVEGLDAGDEVEYATQMKVIKPLVPGQFWFDFSFFKSQIALHEELQVSAPKSRKVIVRSPGLTPIITRKGSRIVYTWKTDNLKDKTPRPVRPGYQPPPAVEITSFQNWAQVGRWWGGLEKEEMKPTAAIRAQALALTKNATTEQQKVHAIYKYVSEQFRYISISFGIGRYRPHAAADVLRNQYGDCKDKETLLASLLQAVGIKIYPALISATSKIDPEVPSPAQFDHVIGYIPLGQKGLWLDTTAEVAPEGFLVPVLLRKQALLIPDGEPAALTMTPSAEPFPSFVRFEADGKLGSDDTYTGKIQRTAHGYSGLLLQLLFRDVPQSKWQKLAQGISRLIGFGGTVSNVKVSSIDAIDHPFSYSYDYTRENYGDWKDHKIVAALPPFGMPDAKQSKGKPLAPIYFNGPTDFIYTSKVTLPKGYIPQLPKDVNLTFDFADYHSQYTFQKGVLAIKRTLSIKTDEVPAAQHKDYAKLEKAVSNDEDQFITLSKGPVHTINPKAWKFFVQSGQALKMDDLNGADDLLQQAINLDPKFERAWVAKGDLHLLRGDWEEGYADLQKAIALDPKDPHAYVFWAQGLIRQLKETQAIGVLQKLVKQDPGYNPGHVMLGSLLLKEKKYSEAVPQFQANLAAAPGNPLTEMSLAQAYAGAGNGAKAADLFKKATTADPMPRVWETAAASLAKFKQQLPAAQHYAEMAVKEDEAKAAKITIASAGTDDLHLMGRMASDWGTSGWIYFKENNLAEARKYLEAAWNLSQSEAIGDHLGQLYEKLGNRKEAIRIYTMAAATTPNSNSNEETSLSHPTLDIVAANGNSDAETRLSHLVGLQESKSLIQFEGNRDDIKALEVKLGKISSAEGSAELLILFSPGPKVKGLKFTSGDKPIKALGKAVRSARYPILFPDSTTTQILRHAVLACVGRGYGCDITLSSEHNRDKLQGY